MPYPNTLHASFCVVWGVPSARSEPAVRLLSFGRKAAFAGLVLTLFRVFLSFFSELCLVFFILGNASVFGPSKGLPSLLGAVRCKLFSEVSLWGRGATRSGRPGLCGCEGRGDGPGEDGCCAGAAEKAEEGERLTRE